MLSRALHSLLILSFTLFVFAKSHGYSQGHNAVARRSRGDMQVVRRFSGSKWSWYAAGLGACGQTNTKNDFIVALNTPQYGGGYPGPNCFKTIVMTYNGKTTEATIMDQCPGCPYGGLDLTEGLFSFFDSLGAGIIYGEWHFKGEEPSLPKDTPKPEPTPEPTPDKPSPSPTPTPTPSPEPSSTQRSNSVERPEPSFSESVAIPTASVDSLSSAPSAVPSDPALDRTPSLERLHKAMAGMGGLAAYAARPQN